MKPLSPKSEPPKELMNVVREFGLDLAALVWPTSCVVCGSADRDCCARCRAELQAHAGSLIEMRLQTDTRVCAAGLYENPMKPLLLSLKHEGVTGFTGLLAARLITPLRALTDGLEGAVLLIGAPSRAARVRERGYRHIELLIRAALRMQQQPQPQLALLSRALRAAPGRVAQAGLNSESRRSNAERVSVSRRARSRVSGAQVVLVDDVVTTGATVTACVEALAEAGAQVVGVIALCLVKRRDAAYLKMP